MDNFDKLPLATIGLWVVFVLVAVLGGVQVIRGHMDFEGYIAALTGAGVGFGILGVGRGIAAKKK